MLVGKRLGLDNSDSSDDERPSYRNRYNRHVHENPNMRPVVQEQTEVRKLLEQSTSKKIKVAS